MGEIQLQEASRRGKPIILMVSGVLLAHKWLKKQFYLSWRLKADLRLASAVHFAADREAMLSVVVGNHILPDRPGEWPALERL
jgi:hypothetical protein